MPASSNFFRAALDLVHRRGEPPLADVVGGGLAGGLLLGRRRLGVASAAAGAAAVTRLSGRPRKASTGCVRSSTPLTPSVTHFWMISSTGALRPPKL